MLSTVQRKFDPTHASLQRVAGKLASPMRRLKTLLKTILSALAKWLHLGREQNERPKIIISLGSFATSLRRHGDPRKPEFAAAQVYFAVSTRQNELHKLYQEQQERLATRLKVSIGHSLKICPRLPRIRKMVEERRRKAAKKMN